MIYANIEKPYYLHKHYTKLKADCLEFTVSLEEVGGKQGGCWSKGPSLVSSRCYLVFQKQEVLTTVLHLKSRFNKFQTCFQTS